MAQLRLPPIKAPSNPEGEELAKWMEETFGRMTPGELHRAIAGALAPDIKLRVARPGQGRRPRRKGGAT